jgi:hypothetical protein
MKEVFIVTQLMIDIRDRFLELSRKRDEDNPIVIIEWLKEEGYEEEDILGAIENE